MLKLNKRAKLNVERFLYIIDALQKGKLSGKYRFYSAKNWFKLAAEKFTHHNFSHNKKFMKELLFTSPYNFYIVGEHYNAYPPYGKWQNTNQ